MAEDPVTEHRDVASPLLYVVEERRELEERVLTEESMPNLWTHLARTACVLLRAKGLEPVLGPLHEVLATQPGLLVVWPSPLM